MKRTTLTGLGLSVFVIVFLAFLIRAFGQFLLGPRMATVIAGPIALLAGIILLGVISLAALAKLGLIPIDESED